MLHGQAIVPGCIAPRPLCSRYEIHIRFPPQWFTIKDKTQATVFNSPAHGPSFAGFSSGGLKKINVADISEFGATFHDATGKGDTLFTGKTHCSLIDIEVFSVKPEAA